MIRRILSARSARPRVEAALDAIVAASTWMSASDGELSEEEIDTLVSAVKQIAEHAVGKEAAAQIAATPRLLDQARATRARLSSEGEEAVLKDVVAALEGDFRRDAMVAAYRVITADGKLQAGEIAAFRRLAEALGHAQDETDALVALADVGRVPAPLPVRTPDVQVVQSLRASGWADPFTPLENQGVVVHWYDAALQYPPQRDARGRTVLRLDLDATERTLHLFITDAGGRGPHLLLLYGDRLKEVVAFIDEVKDAITEQTLQPALHKFLDLCAHVFVEQDNKLLKVRR